MRQSCYIAVVDVPLPERSDLHTPQYIVQIVVCYIQNEMVSAYRELHARFGDYRYIRAVVSRLASDHSQGLV